MHVELNDFQKRLLVKSLENFVSALPEPPNTPIAPGFRAIESMHDLVRTEVTTLLGTLNGPGDLKPQPVQNTFRNIPEKAV